LIFFGLIFGLTVLLLQGELSVLGIHFAGTYQNKLTTRANSAHFEKSRPGEAESEMNSEFSSGYANELKETARQFTKIEYLYRDYGNWKFWGEFWLDGTVKLHDIKPYLLDEVSFVPRELGIPSLTPEKINEDDHWLHEVVAVSLDDRPADNATILPSELFLSRLRAAHAKGWYNLCPWV
jgi:hypothetical protein